MSNGPDWPTWPFTNAANTKSQSRVQGSAIVVFLKNTKMVETLHLKDLRAISVAKEGFAKHGPVTMLVKQKGECWRHFQWKSKQMGTTHRRACLSPVNSLNVSAEIKMIAMLAEMD